MPLMTRWSSPRCRRDVATADRQAADVFIASCADCAALHADLRRPVHRNGGLPTRLARVTSG